jgi:hypothetical protein
MDHLLASVAVTGVNSRYGPIVPVRCLCSFHYLLPDNQIG